MKDRKEGLLWTIRAEHTVLNDKSLRKAFASTSRRTGNEVFARHHSQFYKSIWRGWCTPEKAARLDW